MDGISEEALDVPEHVVRKLSETKEYESSRMASKEVKNGEEGYIEEYV